MGEKGNDLGAVTSAPSVIERTTTVVADTTGEIAGAIKDQAIGAAAGGIVGAATERVRRDDEKDDPDSDTA